ncbi:hypothetical protein H696_03395 [Fonticula alba]|uniref:FERM domain-containing protein n=1 Tax=Fonticula alba TaxID=691883 RepID=A0A058Z6M8_FONAL|nr:hypothetical protein H696_03395 [Fonticula alba]KCV69929.1 hypothetical protein H696_03395 [Fonticula alba]|eukprot:XP_009495535.1 hypothetical protein H696_03395 [Fonticula alba]
MSKISLRVSIPKMGSTKTLQFSLDISIAEACREIRSSINEDPSSGADHGIFWPEQTKWLDPRRTFNFYDLSSGATIEYRKKHRPQKVRLADESEKTWLVDDSLTIEQLTAFACEKLNILNPDEYSFTTEKLEAKSREAAVEARRKGLSPPGDAWLIPSKTLKEQDVDESEVLIFRKKFFFSDQNIDRNDPVQLNLVYNQAQQSIIRGVNPCTQDEAAQFAALQCQILTGNHEPDKHTKSGFIEWKNYLPDEYVGKKDVEKKVYMEHRKIQGMTAENAKFRYIQLCRSLKTYGITFFHVKEKLPRRNKLIDVLLGVTRDSVMRFDGETKALRDNFPLTTLRRWAATPTHFTMDFGDYADSYLIFQTQEGDAISQLISGYIDIIVKKKKKEAERQFDDDEAEVAISDETIPASKATAITMVTGQLGLQVEVNVSQPGVVGGAGSSSSSSGSMAQMMGSSSAGTLAGGRAGAQAGGQMSLENMTDAQKALFQTIMSGFASINAAQSNLSITNVLPATGSDPAALQWRRHALDQNRQEVSSQLAAHLASTASICTLTNVDVNKIDYPQVGTCVGSISSNLTVLTSGSKMVAALLDDPNASEALLDACRQLSDATQRFFTAMQPVMLTGEKRQDMLGEARAVSAAASAMLQAMGEQDVSPSAQSLLNELAKAVALAVSEAAQHSSKNITTKCENPTDRAAVAQAIRDSVLSASQLAVTTSIVAPSIHTQLCQQELITNADQVEKCVNALVSRARQACNDGHANDQLAGMADRIRDALKRLIECARHGGQDAEEMSELERQAEIIISNIQTIIDNPSDSVRMISSIKTLVGASSKLSNLLKQQAMESNDPAERDRLLDAARNLAGLTHALVEVGREAARNPNDPRIRENLLAASRNLQAATRAALTLDQSHRKAFVRLLGAAKSNAATLTQLISAAKACSPYNRNQASQMQLINASKNVADRTGNLALAIREFSDNQDDPSSQLRLLAASKAMLAPGASSLAAARAASQTVGDQAAQARLLNISRTAGDSLRRLKEAIDMAESLSGSLELDSAIDSVRASHGLIKQAQESHAAGTLQPGPDQSLELCELDAVANTKAIGTSLAQLCSAAAQGHESYTGVSARDSAAALQSLANAVTGVAACCTDRDDGRALLEAARELLAQSEALIRSSKTCVGSKGDPEAQRDLAQHAAAVNRCMTALIEALPGQREINRSIASMRDQLQGFSGATPAPVAGDTFMTAQSRLTASAGALNVAASALVGAARSSPQQLQAAAQQLEQAFASLIAAGSAMQSQTSDPAVRAELDQYMNDVFNSVSSLLQSSMAYSADPSGNNLANLLNLAAKGVADSISNLLSLGASGAPGVKEANSVIQKLDYAVAKVDTVNSTVPDTSDTYHQSLRKLADSQTALQQSFAAVTASSRGGVIQSDVGTHITKMGDSMLDVVDAAVRALYLIGVADPGSTEARRQVISAEQVSLSVKEVQNACGRLRDPATVGADIMAAATAIAQHTSALCNACKAASVATSDPEAKQQFLGSAKAIATATGALVADIKSLTAHQHDPAARVAVETSARPLVEAVQALQTLSYSPEFAATPAKVSLTGQNTQAPLTHSSRDFVISSKDTVEAIKKLCLDPTDVTQQAFNDLAKAVGDQLRRLVNQASQMAPGQLECNEAIDQVNMASAEIQAASVNAAVGELQPTDPTKTTDSAQLSQVLLNNYRAVLSSAELVAASSKTGHHFAQAVETLSENFEPFATATIDTAAAASVNGLGQDYQDRLLEAAKNFSEAVAALLYPVKAAGGNPDATAQHMRVDQQLARLQDAGKELVRTVEGGSGGDYEIINDSIATVSGAMERLAVPIAAGSPDSPSAAGGAHAGRPYNELADEVIAGTRVLAQQLGELARARTSAEVSRLATDIAHSFNLLADTAHAAAGATNEADVSTSILDAVRLLGGSMIRLLDSSKLVAANPNDMQARSKAGTSSREATTNVSRLVAAVKTGSKGVQACEHALFVIDDILADLDTTLMFASSGTLDPIGQSQPFGHYKEPIAGVTRELAGNVKALLESISQTQDHLAEASGNSADSMATLRDHIKNAVTAVSSADVKAQTQLLEACIAVAQQLKDNIEASVRATSRRPEDIANMRTSTKRMTETIQNLISAVKLVGDESTRALRSLDSSMDAVRASIAQLRSDDPVQGTALPEDVVLSAKAVTAAAVTLVSASTATGPAAQDDLIKASTAARVAVDDLLRAGKAVSAEAPEDKRAQMHNACAKGAESVLTLFDTLKAVLGASRSGDQVTTNAMRGKLQNSAKQVADSINLVVGAAGHMVPTGYVDPNDPNVIAERELLAAASAIEAAARKLAALQPAEGPRAANEDLPFEEQIVEAAKAIAMATSALVRSATHTQREIVANDRQTSVRAGTPYHSDGTWSDGLVSAAKAVASATGELCEAANDMVQGKADRARIIATSRAVSGSTQQLLSAATVKSSITSHESQNRLRGAGAQVSKATRALIEAAEQNAALDTNPADEVSELMASGIGSRKAEIELQMKMLRMEQELEEARRALSSMRRQRYDK